MRGKPPERDLNYITPMWRSPMVLGIAGALVALCLSGVVLWFMVQRRGAEKQFDAAMTDLGDAKFQSAMKRFDKFLESYPDSELAEKAIVWRGIARIRLYTDGGTPSWRDAFEAQKQLLAEARDKPFYRERIGDISDLITRTAEGFAVSARDRADPAGIEQSLETIALLDKAVDPEVRPVERLDQIQALLTQARLTIEKDTVRREGLQKMEAALAAAQPMRVFAEHEALFLKYPDLKKDAQCQSLREKARVLEAAAVQFQPLTGAKSPAAAGDGASPPAVSLVRRKASPTAVPSGRVMPTLVADSIYALDTGNGEALWRSVLGFEPAFLPLPVDETGGRLLAHRANDNTLLLLEGKTGKELWRRPLESKTPRPFAPPAVHGGIAYFVVSESESEEAGRLLLVKLDTGEFVGEYLFPQPLVTSPVFDLDRNTVLALGEQASLYVVNPRTRVCERVIPTDHDRDAIRCPPVMAGRFLFVAEAIGLDNSLLRCFVLNPQDGAPKQSQNVPLKGWVWHSPFALGGRLFVTTDRNAHAVFDLADESDANPVTEILSALDVPQSRIEQPYPIATSERDFWTMGDRLLHYEVKVENKHSPADWERKMAGGPLMPPRAEGGRLLCVSQNPDTGVVTAVAIDARTKDEQWQTELGALPQALRSNPKEPGQILVHQGSDVIPIPLESQQRGDLLERPLSAPAPAMRRTSQARYRVLRDWTSGILEWQGIGGDGLMHAELGSPPRAVPVPAVVSARPATFGDGVLLPGENGLLYWIDPRDGKELSDPFVGPYVNGRPVPLGPVLPLSHREVVAAIGSTLLKLAVDDTSFPHFVEVARIELEGQQVQQLARCGSSILATLGEKLLVVPQDSFALDRPIAERLDDALTLSGEVVFPPTTTDSAVVYISRSGVMEAVEVAEGTIRSRWRLMLPSRPIDEPLVEGDGLWLSFPDGTIRQYSSAQGDLVKELSAGRPILDGPWQLGDRWVVVAPDGSIATLSPLPQTSP